VFLSPAKTAELIEILFGRLTHVGLRNHILHGVQIPQGEAAIFGVVWACTRPPVRPPGISHAPGVTNSHWSNRLIIRYRLWVTAVVYAANKLITGSTRLLQSTALLLTGQCRVNFSPVKNLVPRWCSLLSKFFDRLLLYWCRWCCCCSN